LLKRLFFQKSFIDMKWSALYLAFLYCCLAMADLYAFSPQNDFEAISQLETQPSSLKRDTLLISSYCNLAYQCLYKNASLSNHYGQKALKLALNRQWDKGKLLAYNVLSHYYFLNDDLDVLMELATESVELAHQQNMPVLKAEAYRFIAHAYSEYFKPDSAYSYYKTALSIIKEEKNDSLQAAFLEDLGSHYRDHNNYPKAIESYDKAESLFREIDSNFGIAFVTMSRGYLYIYTKEFTKAIDHFKRSLTLFDQLDLDYGRMSAYNDLANGYYLLRKYNLAISNAQKALDIATKSHSSQQMNWALTTLYRSHRDQGYLRVALRYMEELNYNRRNQSGSSIARRYNMFHLLYQNEKKDEAIRSSELARQLMIQRFLVVFLIVVLIAAGLVWRKNQQLRKKNKEIREAMVKGQTLERKRVAAELHDTLGGTIAAINWYMSGINKNSLPKAEQQIYNRLQDMIAGAYQDIRSISHNYLPRILEQEGLVQALQRLIEKLNQNNQIKFTLEINGIDIRPDRQVEFELYSTVLELTNNIFKHAEANHAYISLTGTKKRFTLNIVDDGKGFDEIKSEGMGLRNVRNRVESLGGNLVVTNEKDRGTFIRIVIPRNQESFA
jgi:two-component system, NarL family, sensor histidine kinase LiaS